MKHASKETVRHLSVKDITYTKEGSPEAFPEHWHEDAEFTVALKDDCIFRIADVEYRLKTGDILLVWPRELHEVLKVPPEGTAFIQFSPAIAEKDISLLAAISASRHCRHIKASDDPETCRTISDMISETGSICKDLPLLSEARSRICVCHILLTVGRYLMQEQNISFSGAEVHIRNACRYMAEHSAEDITQEDVARAIGLSRYYFSGLFKKCMHTSFSSYLSQLRVRNAVRLMADRDLSVTECAFRAGFRSSTTFNKTFRQITGCTPREYRKLRLSDS